MSYEEEQIHDLPICLNEEKEIDSCLVVCFEEHENDDGEDKIDTRLFVTYDHATESYVVNGKRQDIFSKKGRNKTNLKHLYSVLKSQVILQISSSWHSAKTTR